MTASLNPILPSEHSLCNSCSFMLVPQSVVLVSPEGKGDFGSGHTVDPTTLPWPWPRPRPALARQVEWTVGGTCLLRFRMGCGGPFEVSWSETGIKTLASRMLV